MENNEMMEVYENEVMEGEIVENEKTGMSTGVAMLIGAGVTAAGIAVVKLAKKGVAAWKAHRELKKPDREVPVSDEQIAEVTE